ncbi:MAG: hypothetical protein CM15mP49_34130 [Actinomycetota bacterium]|nr:MAG: hypothetical protein CM15mP49_34130 [Actinomycetota bacterium]
MDSQACLTRLACNSKSVGELKGRLNSLANRAAKLGVRFGPPPPTIIGIPLSCAAFGRQDNSLELLFYPDSQMWIQLE